MPVDHHVFEQRGLDFEANPSGEFQLELRGTLASTNKTNATLDEPQLRLLEASLRVLGARGGAVLEFINLAGAIAHELNVSDAELGKVRFGAALLGLCNLGAGRQPWEPVLVDVLAELAGSGWRSVKELISRTLELAKPPPGGVSELALQTALCFAMFAQSPKPTAAQKTAALQALKGKRFPQAALDAVTRGA